MLIGPSFCNRYWTFPRALNWSNNDVKSIIVSEKKIKVTQFGEDRTVFVSDHQSVINFLKLLHEFKHTSGLEINTGKTETMWLGTGWNKTDTLSIFKCPQEPIQALGIFFSFDYNAANILNLERKFLNWKIRLKSK